MKPVHSTRTRSLTERLANLTQEVFHLEETMTRRGDRDYIRYVECCRDHLFDALAHLRCLTLLLKIREGGENEHENQ